MTRNTYARTNKIRYKIIRNRELNRIMNYLKVLQEDMNINLPEDHLSYFERTTIRFEISYENGFNNSGEDSNILDDNKVIESARFILDNLNSNKKIEIILSNGGGMYTIHGPDKDWLHAKTAHIEEIFQEAPKQNFLLSNISSQILITNTFSLILGTLLFFMVHSIFELPRSTDFDGFLVYVGSILLGASATYFILFTGLRNLYPLIEFDTSNINRKTNRKKLIWKTVIIVLIPLVLNFISSLLF